MEQLTRIDNNMIQKVVTREEIINIEDLERQRDGYLLALENDRLQREKYLSIKKELESTNLAQEDVNFLLGRIATAESGITQKMVDDLNTQIQSFRGLQIEEQIQLN